MQEQWAKHLKPKKIGVFKMITNIFKRKNTKPERLRMKNSNELDKGSQENFEVLEDFSPVHKSTSKKPISRKLIAFLRNRAVLVLASAAIGSAVTSAGFPVLAPYFTPENISLLLMFTDIFMEGSEAMDCVKEVCQ